MTRIKVCGNTSIRDALAAADAGADALGFIFVRGTPRYVTPEAARDMIAALPPLVTPVGVFADQPLEEVLRTIACCGLGVVQLHGAESPAFCRQIPARVIKAVRVRDTYSLAGLGEYRVHAFLLDSYVEGAWGGTGRRFPWELGEGARAHGRVILSGGLTPENVAEAVECLHPYGVDVCTGVEAAPGRKDPDRVRAFIARVRASDARNPAAV